MNGPTSFVGWQLRKIEGFNHDTLTHECCVPVDKNWHDCGPVIVRSHTLPCPDKPFHNRIHDLKMTRVWRQVHAHFFAIHRLNFRRKTHVIFYITIDVIMTDFAALKLLEHEFFALAHDIHQGVQSTPVGHTYGNFLDSSPGAIANDHIHQWHKAVRALQ